VAGKRFVKPEDCETQIFDWGSIKWMSEPRVTDAQKFTTGVVLLAPGKGHTRHNHPGVEEILYIVSGQGVQMVEDENGKPIRQPVGGGDLVHIPADVYHETINSGWEPLKLIAIYAPCGPEALLRGMAEKIIPAGELA
jgi:oxalate decarboxylase/phosphoglucose isomerase-like protein (cupin superfamily)